MRIVEQSILERCAPLAAPDDSSKIAALLKRAALLPPEDRVLIELLQRNATRRQIADILKVPAGTVCRRVHRLSKRLHDPIVVALLDERCPLESDLRQIGVERLLLDLSLNELAHKHQRPMSEIKRMLEYIRGWHNGVVEGFQWGRHARSSHDRD